MYLLAKEKTRALIISFLITFITTTADSQNQLGTVTQFYWDSISLNSNFNYEVKKAKYLKFREVHGLFPSCEFDFIRNALRAKDTQYFKENIGSLIKDFGFKFNRTDTLRYDQNEFNDLVYELDLSDWLIQVSDKLYPEWISANPISYEFNQRIFKLNILDQTRDEFYSLYDDCELSKEYLKRMDFDNFAKLLMICKENDNMVPNRISNGFGAETWNLILIHNLGEDNMFDVWGLILPYIEKAYFENKIGANYFYLFDTILERTRGYQYYGFLDNVPVHEAETQNQRIKKYALEGLVKNVK